MAILVQLCPRNFLKRMIAEAQGRVWKALRHLKMSLFVAANGAGMCPQMRRFLPQPWRWICIESTEEMSKR
jgi:hypothetical protein